MQRHIKSNKAPVLAFTLYIGVPIKRYKYCGKEQDEESGLYYYGARYYAPWLCRFSSVDPKALEYVHQSSYVFADNNPIVKYDVNGEGAGEDEKSNFYILKNDEQAKKDILSLPSKKNQEKENKHTEEKGYVRIDQEGKVTLDFTGLSDKKIKKLLKKDEGLALINDLINAKDQSGKDVRILYQTEGPFEFSGYRDKQSYDPDIQNDWGEIQDGYETTSNKDKPFFFNASKTTYGVGLSHMVNGFMIPGKVRGTLLPKLGFDGQVAIAKGDVTLFKQIEELVPIGTEFKDGKTIEKFEKRTINKYNYERSNLVKHELRENLIWTAEGKSYLEAHSRAMSMYGNWDTFKFKWRK